MFERLLKFLKRKKNSKKASKMNMSVCSLPPPSDFKPFNDAEDDDYDAAMNSFVSFTEPKTQRFSIISMNENSYSNVFEHKFQVSKIPNLRASASGWQSSRPYSQNATRYRFHGSSVHRFNSSRNSSHGTPKQHLNGTGTPSSASKSHCSTTPRRRPPLRRETRHINYKNEDGHNFQRRSVSSQKLT